MLSLEVWGFDLEFYQRVSDFLYRLLEDSAIRNAVLYGANAHQKIKNELRQLENEKSKADLMFISIINNLENSVKNSVDIDSGFAGEGQFVLEDMILQIGDEYKRIKIELFRLVDSVIANDI